MQAFATVQQAEEATKSYELEMENIKIELN
jgi:hypothetical protein